MRMAVRNVYRDAPSAHAWSYLKRRGIIITSASYSTGTVAFDFTGGASERLVTLASGTWPSWARYGTLIIDSQPYKVESRVSDSLLTLDSVTNPGADVASGTSYTLYRSQYPLPNGFRRIGVVVDLSSSEELLYVPPDQVMEWHVGESGPSTPSTWTIRGLRGDYVGQRAIEFQPPPTEAKTYHYLFANECRELGLPPETEDGTVTVSSGSTTVTGTSTAFASGMVGAVMRFSPSTLNKPTNLAGSNPYTHQALISAYTSATAVTIDTAPSATLTAVKYTVSDPIDMDAGTMLTWFLKACEAELAQMLRHEKWEKLRELARYELQLAKETDYPKLNIRRDPMERVGEWGDYAIQVSG